MFDNLRKINSLTKYPSIPTYHKKANKGGLEKDLTDASPLLELQDLEVYEKIDGENTRIIFLVTPEGNDYLIGSREELLYACGDRIAIPTGNIAEYFTTVAESLNVDFDRYLREGTLKHGLYVFYFESYGGETPKTSEYSNSKIQSGRLFDISYMTLDELEEMMEFSIEMIASWRQHGNQPFSPTKYRDELARLFHLPTAPLLGKISTDDLPTELSETYSWMTLYSKTQSAIDGDGGKSEGVILRATDRSFITKLRFQDYEKTFKKMEIGR